MSESFAHVERVTRKNDFRRVHESGKKRVASSFILLYSCSPDRQYRRLGITASRKVGNAVIRNRCKRMIREIFRKNKDLFPERADSVVIVRRNMAEKDYNEVLEEFRSVLQP